MDKTPTPHNEARLGDFAKTVIMPGDPKRARHIAKKFLTDAKLVNDIRGAQAYTGYYNGHKISVMSSGMGNPSMGIYCQELFNNYDVENIIRVGSCGTLSKDINLGDIIVALNCFTQTNFSNMFERKINNIDGSKALAKKAAETAKTLNIPVIVGKIYNTDSFYNDLNQTENMLNNDCAGVEMETAALYYIAQQFHKNALTICTVSDNLTTLKHLTAKERQTSFDQMLNLALNTAVKL